MCGLLFLALRISLRVLVRFAEMDLSTQRRISRAARNFPIAINGIAVPTTLSTISILDVNLPEDSRSSNDTATAQHDSWTFHLVNDMTWQKNSYWR